MKKFGYFVVFILVAGLLFTTAHMISAQQQRRREGGGGPFGGRQMDPEEMLKRQLERIMENMNLPADEAAVLEPMIEKILRTRTDQDTESGKLLEDLQKAMDDKSNVSEKLEAFKTKRAEHKKKMEELQKELLEVLTVEQEAQLTILRVVHSEGAGGFMRFGGGRGDRPGGGNRGGGRPGGGR